MAAPTNERESVEQRLKLVESLVSFAYHMIAVSFAYHMIA